MGSSRGKIRKDEDVQEALVREVEEEINHKVELIKLFDVVVSNFKDTEKYKAHLMLVVFKCKLLEDKEVTISDEHSEWQWISIEEAKEHLSVKYPSAFIEKLDDLKV